jgi:subtilase family serine protease
MNAHVRAPALAAVGLVAALSATSALAGVPYPTRATPKPVEAGLVDDLAGQTPLTVTVMLKLKDAAGAEALVQHVSTPGDKLYRQFLTTAEFLARFGPDEADAAKVEAAFSKFGLSVERSGTSTLHVTGIPANLERAFAVSLHQYNVAASNGVEAYSFRAPDKAPSVPAEISGVVAGVVGLDNRPAMFPHVKHAALGISPKSVALGTRGATTPPNVPGYWTILDFADYYDVNPLYQAGITGKGQVIGIATFASLKPSDAYTYWSGLGLTFGPTRIEQVKVDGGSGPPSDDAGSFETTLDVEQSGGIAPSAKIKVYEAPNTNQGFVDLFAAFTDANVADVVSCSWGEWEWFDNLYNSPVTDPSTGKTVSALAATHQILLQAALQGQTVIASAGDAGAYDANDGEGPPDFSLALSVDYPGSDPAIVAAGGTSVPATLTFPVPKHKPVVAVISTESAWNWGYILPLCQKLGLDPVACGIFPVGGGGGVSTEMGVPPYQKGLAGVQVSQPDQAFIDEDTVPPTTIDVLPAGYAGRNVPDISLNSDPETGYAVGYTSSVPGSAYGVQDFWGGTSFAAPDFNGVFQLVGEKAGKRLGLVNQAIYALAAKYGYAGANAPLRYIAAGNNDFYYARKGYSPAAGLGTIDVSNLAAALK